MKLSAKKVLTYILKEYKGPQTTIRDIILEAHDYYFTEDLGQLAKHELVLDLEDCLNEEIKKYCRSCKDDGVSPKIKFGINPEIIINIQAEIHEARLGFIEWMENLNPIHFELFCKKILELEGCKNVSVTPPSSDGGVDFYGTKRLSVTDEDVATILEGVDVLVVGQAKRYTIKEVSVEDIRNFIGAFHMIRNAEYKEAPKFLPNPIPSNSFKPHTPTLLMYVTSGKATARAVELCRWLGVKLVDVDKIVDLLNYKGVGLKRFENKVIFNQEDFAVIEKPS